MSETTGPGYKRSFRNLPVLPNNKFRACFTLCAVASLASGALGLLVLVTLSQLKATVPDLDSSVLGVLVGSVALALLSSLLSLVFAALISHRIYGPLVAIKKQLACMEAGDFSVRGTLRKGDEFVEVMTSLNHIAESAQASKRN